MMTVTQATRRAFGVEFKDLERWNVSFFKTRRWYWQPDVIKPLSVFTSPEVIPLSLYEAKAKNIPIISKISFSGELFLRPPEDYEGYKGPLFLVRPNRIIFSKINARRGCIFYAPSNHREFAVSGEYPVLKLDEYVALGEYINLALRVGPAKDQLFGAAAGMAKARTYVEDFQRVKIPLPPLELQRAIVARWKQAHSEIAVTSQKVRNLEFEIDQRFFDDLEIQLPKRVERPKSFSVLWKDLIRWSVGFSCDRMLGLQELPNSTFKYELLGSVAKVSYGIQKSPANRPSKNARPYLRVANVRKGYLDLSEIKQIDVPESEMESYRLETGDILFVEGNGSRAELGRVAIWNGEIANCVHQNHLIKVRVDQSRLLPDFAMKWFNAELGRGHFFRSAKTSSGLGTINSEEVRSAPIPLPPLATQRAIVERVREGQLKIAQERQAANLKASEAEVEIEALILGTKKLAGIEN